MNKIILPDLNRRNARETESPLPDIIIANEKHFAATKREMIKGGPGKLHMLADFDKTLTRAFVDGEPIRSIISILRDGRYLTPDYAPQAHALFEKYHPIEQDQTLPLEKKRAAMNEWWTTHFELLIKCGLKQADIAAVANSGKIVLRPGVDRFFRNLKKKKVPIVILSATGLGEVIPTLLEKQGLLYEGVIALTNTFTWDKDRVAVKINRPVIHSLNKEEASLAKIPAFEKIKKRKNIILLGDSVSDVDMVKGFKYENILKIGFLNEKIDEKLALYQKYFDALILNDGSFDFVNELLREII